MLLEKKSRKTKNIILRAPLDLHKMLMEIKEHTHMSLNAVCLEILRREAKKILKEFEKK